MTIAELMLARIRTASAFCVLAALINAPAVGVRASEFLHSNDVVCFLGGANVVAAQEYGYLETILRMKFPNLNLRFRSLAHEGDTVFEQPRDYNYPAIAKQLDQTGATVVICYFGQTEALQGTNHLQEFAVAYEKLLETSRNRRLVVVSPFVFEPSKAPLPDLSLRNRDLLAYFGAIEELAQKHGWTFVNLNQGKAKRFAPLTSDGLHLTAYGHLFYDSAIAAQLGATSARMLWANPTTGALSLPLWEQTRQRVLAKNRLWFAYYRPMNWAFLGGDRTDQPSSRDHRDPKIRWFPDEMKRFVPLLEREEDEIGKLAAAGAGR